MARAGNIQSISALRDAARRKLPRFAFDFIDGGALEEVALKNNRLAFDSVRIRPRILSGNLSRTTHCNILGSRFNGPFGIAPVGLADIIAPGTDIALAAAARDFGLPYVLSTAGSTSLEEIADICPDFCFQLYVGSDPGITKDLLKRLKASTARALFVTGDVPTPGKRLRDAANGFAVPLKPGGRMLVDVLTHPGWAWNMLTGGAPNFANLQPYAIKGSSVQSLATLMAQQSTARLDWDLLKSIRDEWDRPLVLKGVLHPADAIRARDMAIDGIVVSNHGGRQLDAALSPIEAIAAIRASVGEDFPIILDSGIRSGEDILRALCLGANFVLLGRPFLYAVAALGAIVGPTHLIEIIEDELDRAMGQVGATTLGDLDTSLIAL